MADDKSAVHLDDDNPWPGLAPSDEGAQRFFHGRGDGADPEDLSRCMHCGFETHRYRSECERCGTGLQSRRWSRRFGAVLVLYALISWPLGREASNWWMEIQPRSNATAQPARYSR